MNSENPGNLPPDDQLPACQSPSDLSPHFPQRDYFTTFPDNIIGKIVSFLPLLKVASNMCMNIEMAKIMRNELLHGATWPIDIIVKLVRGGKLEYLGVKHVKDVTTVAELKMLGELTKLESVQFGMRFNLKLVPGDIPNRVTSVEFRSDFDQPLVPGTLPADLRHLIFGFAHSQELEPGAIPNELRTLVLGGRSNHRFPEGVLPSKLEEIRFGCEFNLPLHYVVFPHTVKRVELGTEFDRKIKVGDLPPNLQELKLGGNFNKSFVPGSLPETVTKVTLGFVYDKEFLPGVLPAGLRELELGWSFNQYMSAELFGELRALERLKMGYCYVHKVDTSLMSEPKPFINYMRGWRE